MITNRFNVDMGYARNGEIVVKLGERGVFEEMVCNSLLPDTDDEYAKQKAQIKAGDY